MLASRQRADTPARGAQAALTGAPVPSRYHNLATAIEMFREMGMVFWLPEAGRELAEADG